MKKISCYCSQKGDDGYKQMTPIEDRMQNEFLKEV